MNKQISNKAQWFIDQMNVYQSANSDHQSIKNNFIVRLNEFNIIIESLKNKEQNDSLQNELILGRRGSGKSTLLKRIEIEIIEDIELKSKFIPVNLAEEQAGIYRLFDLWDEVLKEISYHSGTQLQLKNFSEFKQDQDYTRYLYQNIHEICATQNKKIVLLLDNFDRIVENFNDDGNLLRETLINFNDLVIIAGSTRMDEHFWSYDMPFYEFFRRHRIEALDRDELNKLLNHWSEALDISELKDFIVNNPGKIENIRLLTDGLPRTIQFFIQMVLQNSNSLGYDYLKKIMDNATPLYQERLNYQTAQLRKIILEMAFMWEACTTKQLVEKCKMESKLVSANLKTLVDRGIVDKIETSKKNHLYRISERFFNMWLIITQGNPEQKRKAKWLSIFLENWYDAKDLKKLVKKHIKLLESNELDRNDAIILSKGLSQCKYTTTFERDQIIELTEKLNSRTIEKGLLELPQRFQIILEKVEYLIINNNFKEALELSETIENIEDGYKYLLIGSIYFDQNSTDKAIKYFSKAEQKGNKTAYSMLGFAYDENKKYDKAEKYYLMAIDNGDREAINDLASFYDRLKKYSEAEKYYLMAIENGNVKAMNNLAILYYTMEKYSEAERYYLMAIENGKKIALFNLALLYVKLKKYSEAERYFLMAIENGIKDAIPDLAKLYHSQKKYDKAEKYYLMSVEKDNKGLSNLAIFYYELNKNKIKSLELFREALIYEQSNESLMNMITAEVWNGIFNNVEERIISLFQNDIDDLYDFILDMLIQQQKTLVLKMFNHKEFGKALQDKYSVLYYVCLFLNNKTEDNLELRIPPEIKPTIDEVLAKIDEREKFYGYR